MPISKDNQDAIADLRRVRHVVLDMDGTIYLGNRVFDATCPLLELLSDLGVGYSLVTNNNSRGRQEYVEHLHRLGIDVGADDVVTSAQATVEYLCQQMADRHSRAAAGLFVLGSPGLQEDLQAGGFEIVEHNPDVVIVGYDPHLTYGRIAQTAYWISTGVPYFATHPDKVCPTDEPLVLPDCGAFCALLEAATGRSPDYVCGKPNPAMVTAICTKHNVRPQQVAVIGDRLYTDMEMARRAGCFSILTLTGETAAADAADTDDRVDLVVTDLDELSELLRVSRNS